jgi:2-dehydro-3-deoxyphosphogluconate aldolase / (4S)-4-hydroxy-2-oxoglutarate aldolase
MTLATILHARLVAILRLDDLSTAGAISESLFNAGVQALEFTLTNSNTPEVVGKLRSESLSIRSGASVIGIGSVRSLEEAKIAIDAGAQFVVSPITSVPIIDYCKQNKIIVCPGAYTPTEIAISWDAGADIVKVFPARNLGYHYIRDVLAPMPYLKLMPTGGVDLNNIPAYFAAGAAAVGIGSQLLDPVAIQERDWDRIATTAALYVQACKLSDKP